MSRKVLLAVIGIGAFGIVEDLPLEAGVAREGDRIDVQPRTAEGEGIADFDGRAGRRIGWKIIVPHELELVEIGGINEVHISLERADHRSAGLGKHLLEGFEAMARLYFHQRRTHFVPRRVQSNDPSGLVDRIDG